MCVCLCLCVPVHMRTHTLMCATVYMRRLEDNMKKAILSFNHMGPRVRLRSPGLAVGAGAGKAIIFFFKMHS